MLSKPMRLLLVDDDPTLAQNIRTLLVKASYSVDVAQSVETGYMATTDNAYDLIILDWTLPDGSGVELCRKLRHEKNTTPILLLTAKNTTDYKVEGLNSGADDYLTKPFAIEELTARIRSLLRRSATLTDVDIKIGKLTIHTNSMTVTRNSTPIPLSPREYALLHYLATHKGTAIDRMELLEHVWNNETDVFSNTVDVHIRYLRKKIDDGSPKKLILTVKGKGYMLCD